MDTDIERLSAIEATVSQGIHGVGTCIEIFGVFIIVLGIAWSTSLFVFPGAEKWHYDRYKIRIGRSLLLGLEVLVAADIVKTIANRTDICQPRLTGRTGRGADFSELDVGT